MLATQKQVEYLRSLSAQVAQIKARHPSLVPLGLYYEDFQLGITSEYAERFIRMYRDLLDRCNSVLYDRRRKAKKGRYYYTTTTF